MPERIRPSVIHSRRFQLSSRAAAAAAAAAATTIIIYIFKIAKFVPQTNIFVTQAVLVQRCWTILLTNFVMSPPETCFSCDKAVWCSHVTDAAHATPWRDRTFVWEFAVHVCLYLIRPAISTFSIQRHSKHQHFQIQVWKVTYSSSTHSTLQTTCGWVVRFLLGHFDPWIRRHYLTPKGLDPITQRGHVTSQRNENPYMTVPTYCHYICTYVPNVKVAHKEVR